MVSGLSLFVISMTGCSSAVTVTATRFSGIVLDTSMTVDVGVIMGNNGSAFREELRSALLATGSFSVASPSPESSAAAHGGTAALLIHGTYRPLLSERRTEKYENEKWQPYREKTYTAAFEYVIDDMRTGEFVINGYIEESYTETLKDEERTFLESILNSIVEDFIEGIFSIDRYKKQRRQVIRRFVDEITPHELQVEVRFFKDKELPEIEEAVGLARVQKWKEAIAVFQSAIDKHPNAKNLHKAFYNLGVAYEYDHQFEPAQLHLEKALQMEDDDDYRHELNECKRFAQEHRWRQQYLERLQLLK